MVKSPDTRRTSGARADRQRGYALVALLALMTMLMITAMAAAPSIRQQARRERELETIARGEEVADAIRAYVHYTGRLPTSMEQLIEGAPSGTKKVQVLRASAACDPLTSRDGECGEWRLIKTNDPALVTFVVSLGKYANGRLPATNDPKLQALANQLPRPTAIIDTGTSRDAPCDEVGASSNGPFVGVASRSCADSIIAYYGIEQHAGWVFTPFYR